MSAVTLRDVANAAGVDYSTVSRALNPNTPRNRLNSETVARIRQIADQLGYQRNLHASGLRQGRTFSIGVAVPDMGNPYIAPVLRGIQNTLERVDLTAIILETSDDHARLERVLALLSNRADAVIMAGARHGDRQVLEDYDATTRPVVLALRCIPGSRLPAITADDRAGGALAAGYLGELGHRVLAQITGPSDIQPFVDRFAGFRETAEQSGVQLVDFPHAAVAPTVEEGRRLFTQLLATTKPRPTAVFAHNDALAIGVIDAIRVAGLRCPDDISVIGFNDNPLSDHLSPPLTTIRVPGQDLGAGAAELAIDRAADRTVPAEVHCHPPGLVVRESTTRFQSGR
jgi:LacI family transcriptional regulator